MSGLSGAASALQRIKSLAFAIGNKRGGVPLAQDSASTVEVVGTGHRPPSPRYSQLPRPQPLIASAMALQRLTRLTSRRTESQNECSPRLARPTPTPILRETQNGSHEVGGALRDAPAVYYPSADQQREARKPQKKAFGLLNFSPVACGRFLRRVAAAAPAKFTTHGTSMRDDDRTTPLGLFNYARSYWQSGVLLHRAG